MLTIHNVSINFAPWVFWGAATPTAFAQFQNLDIIQFQNGDNLEFN